MRRTSLGVLLPMLAVAGLTLAGCRSDPDDPAAQCQPVTPPPAAASPDSSGVDVAEQGHSTVPGDYPRISIGAVLRNTTDRVAYRTRVVFEALDANGTSVVTGPQTKYQMIEVPLLLPGTEVAVGDTLVAGEKSAVAKVSVTPSVTAWLPPTGIAPITATVDAGASSRAADGSATLSFTTKGDNCADLFSRGMTFAWRDTAGKLIGGNIDGLTNQSACRTGGATRPVTTMSQPSTVPADADFAKTEVTALCDLQKGPGVVTSGQPVN